MQVLEPSVPTIQQIKHNVCNENHKWTEYSGPKEGEVQLACGCMLPIVAGALNPDGQHKFGTPNCIGSVNDIQVSTLRDTSWFYHMCDKIEPCPSQTIYGIVRSLRIDRRGS